MTLKGSSANRRKFMKLSSAAIASPLLLKSIVSAPEAHANPGGAITGGYKGGIVAGEYLAGLG